MAGIRFSRLVERFIADLERQGLTVLLQGATQNRPARLRIASREYLLFLWAVTPGGGGPRIRPANERRIQLTNVMGLPLVPGVRTLVGGWSAEGGVYAFWDARRHVRFSQNSPSLQVDRSTLERAYRDGLATQLRPTRGGNEVVVAVTPDSLAWYVERGDHLHNVEEVVASVADLVAATPEEERQFLDGDPTEAGAARRYDLVQVLRVYRASRFRPAVLRAYAYRCAVCGCALKLVDSAHIVPVAHPRSTDEVTNGVALCRLHHAAFDNGLLGILPDYAVRLNPRQVAYLQSIGLNRGLEEFQDRLPSTIRLPRSREVRPLPTNLAIGLQARNWPELA